MTKDEILVEIKAMRTNGVTLDPLEVFLRDELESVDFVKGYKHKAKRLNESFEKKQAEFEKVDELKTGHETKIKEKDTKIKTLTLENTKLTSAGKLDKIITDRKLDKKQVEFVKQDWDKFTFEDPEKVDDALNTFVDTGLEKFKKNAEFFGFKEVDPKPGEKPGAGPTDTGNKSDLSKKENNDLIPK